MHHLLAERHHMTVAGVLPVAQTARSYNAVSLQADESVGCAGLNIPDYDAPTQLVKPWERNSRYVDVVMTIPKVQPLRQSARLRCSVPLHAMITYLACPRKPLWLLQYRMYATHCRRQCLGCQLHACLSHYLGSAPAVAHRASIDLSGA